MVLLIINKIRNDQPISNDSKIVVQLSSVVLAAFVVEVLFVVFEVAAVAVAVAPIMESETELENLCNHRTIIWGGGGCDSRGLYYLTLMTTKLWRADI